LRYPGRKVSSIAPVISHELLHAFHSYNLALKGMTLNNDKYLQYVSDFDDDSYGMDSESLCKRMLYQLDKRE
jgi:hypothetical protein